jgi:hypothetical protein
VKEGVNEVLVFAGRNGKRERESKRRGGGGFYTPLTQNIAVEALRLGVSRVNPETPGSPKIPG